MKTERRHELQTNVLADWLGRKTIAIRPYFQLILGGIAAVFIVAIFVTIMSSWQSEQSARGWADYFAAATSDRTHDLSLVAEDHAGTLPAVWATLRQADLELARGIRALYTFRGESIEALSKAKALYAQVEAGATGQPVLKQAAQFGKAQTCEAGGDVEEARKCYQEAIASGKDSSIGKQAQIRLDRLNDNDAAEWLVWFARQTPRPRTPPGEFPGGFPGGGDGLDLPFDLSEIPGRPELSIPVPFEGANERAESSLRIEEPADPTPASKGTEPKGTEPETKKPAATDPATTTPESTTPESRATEPAASTPSDKPASTSEPAPAAEPAPSAEPAPTPDPAPAPETPAADEPVETPADALAGDGEASQ